MPKEKSFNPAAAQRKADKQKEIAKNKKQLQNQRNEKLARRNPERLQKQIDELKELEQGGKLRPKDQDTLKQLERDLKGVRRAREALGDAAPKFAERRQDGRGGGGRQNARQEQLQRRQNQASHLGKRRRGEEDAQSSDTEPEVRDIPMPRDTPPPIPRQQQRERFADPQLGPDGQRVPHALPSKPAPAKPAQTVYSSAPQIRDLKKEAIKFMPSAVAAKRKQVRGQSGRLLEPEEIDRLEKSGYYAAQKATQAAEEEADRAQRQAEVRAEGDLKNGEEDDMDEEVRRFEQELGSIYPSQTVGGGRTVEMEEVEDDGD